MNLTGRAVLITGGKRLGQVVGTEIAARGADVAFAFARSRAEADEAAARVRASGRRSTTLQADLSDPAACDRLVAAAAETLGRLDVLVNMASLYRRRPFEALSVEDWNESLAIDLRATFLCARAAASEMRKVGGGRIVNFSDWVAASRRPRYLGYLPYYVAKSGVIALTEALALELAADRILVNAIAPGPILPPAGMSAEELREVERATPLGRWGGAAEIAKAVLALVETDFITGETIRVDGGRHLK